MKPKNLRIIAFALIGIGGYLTSNSLAKYYQWYLADPIISQEQLAISIIGAIITTSWYFPFFIVSFILLRKAKRKTATKI